MFFQPRDKNASTYETLRSLFHDTLKSLCVIFFPAMLVRLHNAQPPTDLSSAGRQFVLGLISTYMCITLHLIPALLVVTGFGLFLFWLGRKTGLIVRVNPEKGTGDEGQPGKSSSHDAMVDKKQLEQEINALAERLRVCQENLKAFD